MTNVPSTKASGQEVSTHFEETHMPSPHRDTAFITSFARLLYCSQTPLATSPARAGSTGRVSHSSRPAVPNPTEATGM